MLRNRTVEAWIQAGRPPSGSRPGEGDVLATLPDGEELVRYTSAAIRGDLVGRIDELSLWAGQCVGLLGDVLPAAHVVRRVAAQAEALLARPV